MRQTLKAFTGIVNAFSDLFIFIDVYSFKMGNTHILVYSVALIPKKKGVHSAKNRDCPGGLPEWLILLKRFYYIYRNL